MATPSAATSEGRAEAATSKATEGKTERNDVVGGVKNTGKVRVFVCVVTLFYLVPSWGLLIKKALCACMLALLSQTCSAACSVKGTLLGLPLLMFWD